MKTLKSLFIFLFIMSLSRVAFANTGEEALLRELSTKVKHTITTPESIRVKSGEEKITVLFTVNVNGQVIEANAKTNDKKAKEDLEKQFLKMKFERLNPCTQNSVDIHFFVY